MLLLVRRQPSYAFSANTKRFGNQRHPRVGPGNSSRFARGRNLYNRKLSLQKDMNLCLLYEWKLAYRFFIVGGCTVYESGGGVGIYSAKENCYPFLRPCWNCWLVRMCIRHRKPFRMRSVTLTFPVAHAHTCLLETGGPLTFYPSNLQWHCDSPCFSASVCGSIHWCLRV